MFIALILCPYTSLPTVSAPLFPFLPPTALPHPRMNTWSSVTWLRDKLLVASLLASRGYPLKLTMEKKKKKEWRLFCVLWNSCTHKVRRLIVKHFVSFCASARKYSQGWWHRGHDISKGFTASNSYPASEWSTSWPSPQIPFHLFNSSVWDSKVSHQSQFLSYFLKVIFPLPFIHTVFPYKISPFPFPFLCMYTPFDFISLRYTECTRTLHAPYYRFQCQESLYLLDL